MPLINCQIHLELTWSNNCVMSNLDGERKFQITDTKLYVPIVTLSTKDNTSLRKQQDEGFIRSVYWNEYISKINTYEINNNNATKTP